MIVISSGQGSRASRRGTNHDFSGCVTPEGDLLRDKGIVFAVADGIGRERGSREAAETSVRIFLSDYYTSPDTWSVPKVIEHVLEHANGAVRASGSGAATFAAIVFRGRRAFVAHVGDSRVYRLRQGVWTCLTQDHVWDHPDMRNVVSRAVGLDIHLHADVFQDELCLGDIFLVCTDGFYKSFSPESLPVGYPQDADFQAVTETFVETAGDGDDVTVQLIRVEGLPSAEAADLRQDMAGLPTAVDLREGVTIDDFYLSRRLHRGMQSEVYLAEDLRHRRTVALKFLSLSTQGVESEADLSDRFLREEWLGRRIKSPHVLSAIPLEAGRRSRLYYAIPWEKGETLRHRIRESGPLLVADGVEVGLQLCRGLEALHRLQVFHRDIKPDNVLINEKGKALLLDLGVARAGAFTGPEGTPGTPSYMAPELFRGAMADERTEVYALGVTLYEALTRKLPYGEIEPFSQPRFRRWAPPSQYNPDVPPWLDIALGKALEPDPLRRFQALSELQFHLSRREQASTDTRPRVMDSVKTWFRVWKILAIGFAVLALLEFVVLLGRSHE